MSEIISLINEKGGVGKSSSAISIAQILAISGYSILLIDLDPQMNTSKMFGKNDEGNAKDYVIRFEIVEKYIAKNQKNILLQEYSHKLTDFIYEFNSCIPEINSGKIQPEKYNSFLSAETNISHYKLISINKIDLDDIANIAVHYSYDYVMTALSEVYKQYILHEKTIKNLPGLISSIVRSYTDDLKKTA